MTATEILILNNIYITLIPTEVMKSKLHLNLFKKHDFYHM